MCLSPISSDVLFNISNLVITASFPANEQALAGGIFSTVSQLGNSVGLAVTAMRASAITSGAENGSDHVASELKSYQAAFWAYFASRCSVLRRQQRWFEEEWEGGTQARLKGLLGVRLESFPLYA